jgi:monoamine oxidase
MVVIGAGAAGLNAARTLAESGMRVVLIEARERIGGRILSISSQSGGFPVELGAEFIHGEENETWDVVRAARLRTRNVPDRHWAASHGALAEVKDFWEKLGEVTERMNPALPDQDFQSFLDQAWSLGQDARRLAKQYVEGFHAAPADRIGVHALVKAEAAAERDQATRQFRIRRGYGAMLEWFARKLSAFDVTLYCGSAVRTIRWEPGQVEVVAQTAAGQQQFTAERALVTVPLGVLKLAGEGEGGLGFEPKLPNKRRAIEGLGVGSVVKLTLQFRSRFWPVSDFGFIHAEDLWLPTWWSHGRMPVLTRRAGGPLAERLSHAPEEEILEQGLRAVSEIFKVEPQQMRENLVAYYTYNWSADPFACGGYSYTPMRMGQMPAVLGEPVAGTLFFAGEATDPDGEQGTVHGALASGRRAASAVLEASRRGSSLLFPGPDAGKSAGPSAEQEVSA